MNEFEIRDALLALIHCKENIDNTCLADARAYDLQEAGFITRDTGIAIRTEHGAEFMLTIQQTM